MFDVLLVENKHQVDILVQVHAACFPPPSHDNSIEKTFYLPGVFGMIGMEKMNRVSAGFAVCRLVLGEAELLSIGVIPEKRRVGWGRALLHAVFSEARINGADTIILEVAEGNGAAQSLYRGMGFVHAGKRPRYYDAGPGKRIAAEVMRCSL